MKIGICKLAISLKDVDLKYDTNGRFKEMLALKEIFERNRHEIDLLDTTNINKKYDIIYMLNGLPNSTSIEEIYKYKANTETLYYILTDLRLINEEIAETFDAIFTQTLIQIPTIMPIQYYSGMPELAVYCVNKIDVPKDIEFIFGGGLRDREEDFQTYFGKEDESFRLLLKMPERDTRVPINEYHNLLARSKYSLIINDKEYNKYSFITWRYYENIANDVITFLDHKVDIGEIIPLPKNIRIALTVRNYEEVKNKIFILEHNPGLKEMMLQAQRDILTEYVSSGQLTYDCLFRK